jgi:hypothetical protein
MSAEDEQMDFGFMNLILLHSDHRYVSARSCGRLQDGKCKNTNTVGYATANDPTTKECYNEQFLSIKSGCYNEHMLQKKNAEEYYRST